ncbi:lycopene cyclase family protein [Reichenbachiella versicolor]|uniref:lycopene cyclase family protein n=1 Tax=Reichenbachiella versicolor TaxID=1821036 RepID=UPI000D6E68B8|nr:lycopene cyclase family protein [Reichenbachiella versicolor]
MHKDIAIIGAGVSGLQLAIALSEDEYFKHHQIVIIEPDNKNTNEKTFCFWEKGKGRWDEIVSSSWRKGDFFSSNGSIELAMNGYVYKMIRSLDFYSFAKSKLSTCNNVEWIKAKVESVGRNKLVLSNGESLSAEEVFDSRLNPLFQNSDKSINLIQHFKGWVIKSNDPVFDPSRFTMMDYRIRHPEYTAFNYVLPFDSKTALIEYTFFSPETIDESEYDRILKEYIEGTLGIKSFEITETEVGQIPMSNFPFEEDNRRHYTRIGTAGGWVKASTGYSFKRTEIFVDKVLINLKESRKASSGFFKSRFKIYDTLLLYQLYSDNSKGERLFDTLYRKIEADLIFKFLDENTSFVEEFRIMNSFKPVPFMKAFFNWYLFGKK